MNSKMIHGSNPATGLSVPKGQLNLNMKTEDCVQYWKSSNVFKPEGVLRIQEAFK